MIFKTFPSKRNKHENKTTEIVHYKKTNVDWYTEEEKQAAVQAGLDVQEFVRRDTLIQQLATDCKLQTGDTAWPVFPKDAEKYGQCLVIGVCRNYKDFGYTSKWPKNDNPMIVTFASNKDRSTHIFCTENYLTKTKPEMEVTC